jgi:hypothetical protein
MFFRDILEWEWIPRRFDPARALAIPASVLSLIGPDPQVIADEVWAGLNSGPPTSRPGSAPATRSSSSGRSP